MTYWKCLRFFLGLLAINVMVAAAVIAPIAFGWPGAVMIPIAVFSIPLFLMWVFGWF